MVAPGLQKSIVMPSFSAIEKTASSSPIEGNRPMNAAYGLPSGYAILYDSASYSMSTQNGASHTVTPKPLPTIAPDFSILWIQ